MYESQTGRKSQHACCSLVKRYVCGCAAINSRWAMVLMRNGANLVRSTWNMAMEFSVGFTEPWLLWSSIIVVTTMNAISMKNTCRPQSLSKRSVRFFSIYTIWELEAIEIRERCSTGSGPKFELKQLIRCMNGIKTYLPNGNQHSMFTQRCGRVLNRKPIRLQVRPVRMVALIIIHISAFGHTILSKTIMCIVPQI